jgi:iron complex outermembrane receptor protein
VTVTAQKREQSLLEVPIAVTAMGKTELNRRGVENVADLSALAPGLQVSRSPANDSISQIAIRGNSEINPAIYWDPAVGIYLDGVYLGKSQGTVFDVVELNRVEVLRGPQGTLYGRNSIGGAINLVTRAPSGQLGGELALEAGNFGAFAQKLSVDLPQMGRLKLSLAARSEQRDGWVEGRRASAVDEFNDRDSHGLRLAADMAISSSLQAAYRYDLSEIDTHGSYGQLFRANPGFFTFVGLPNFAANADQNRQKTANVDSDAFQQVRVEGHALTLTQQMGAADWLKSISAFRRLRNHDGSDYDGTADPVAETQRYTHFNQLSQELQWVGKRGPLQYVGGLYYYRDRGNTNNPQAYFGGFSRFDSRYGTETDAYAAYGQLDYQALEALSLSAGLRYTSERKQLSRVFGCNAPALGCFAAPGEEFNYFIPEGTAASKTFSATTPSLSVAWRFSPSVNAYARYAEGFKSGGFNGEFSDTSQTPAQNVAETQRSFEPEKQRSYELGLKTELLNGRAQFNAAAFYNQLDNYQASIFVASGAAASVIRNAGKATVQGLELEAAYAPMRGVRLQGNYAYLNSEYDRFTDDSGREQANNRAFVHAPRNTFNLMLDTTLAQTPAGELRAVVDYAYTSSFFLYPYQLAGSGPQHDPAQPVAGDTQVRSHGLLNLRLALSKVKLGPDAQAELALWCRNALDEDEPLNYIDFGPGFGNLTTAYFMDPRTYGLTGSLRWK